MARFHRPALVLAVLLAVVLAVCVGFGWWQNQANRLGGDISGVKCLWLATALICFYVIPGVLWRDDSLSPPLRRLAGWFFTGFLLRAVIEVPVLLFSQGWRCWHGLWHDAVMLAWLLAAGLRLPRPVGEPEISGRRVLPLLAMALIFEMLNAWLFQGLARPQDGVYFAGNDDRFHLVNRLTLMQLVVLWPALMVWLGRYAWCLHRKVLPGGGGWI